MDRGSAHLQQQMAEHCAYFACRRPTQRQRLHDLCRSAGHSRAVSDTRRGRQNWTRQRRSIKLMYTVQTDRRRRCTPARSAASLAKALRILCRGAGQDSGANPRSCDAPAGWERLALATGISWPVSSFSRDEPGAQRRRSETKLNGRAIAATFRLKRSDSVNPALQRMSCALSRRRIVAMALSNCRLGCLLRPHHCQHACGSGTSRAKDLVRSIALADGHSAQAARS